MLSSPAEAFRAAQDAAVRAGAADLAAAAGETVRVAVERPDELPLPYVILGEDQDFPEATDCGVEAELFATVHLWSRTKPTDRGAQARAIGAVLIALLAVELDLEGWVVDLAELESQRYVTDPDRSTHGVLTFRYLLTEQPTESEA